MESLVRDAAAAHMNMLRVWGGGFYEKSASTTCATGTGILIWQDFIFACGIYPEDDAFAENVRIEAVENVRRSAPPGQPGALVRQQRDGTGLGGLEVERPGRPGRAKSQGRLRPHVPPPAARDRGGRGSDRPYWPSSASSGVAFTNPNGQVRGDTHYWDVWHGRKPFTAYRQQFPRFMSEFGFQALPPYKTIQTYAEPKDQNMTSYVMEHHQRSRSGNGLMVGQMTDTFRMPKDFQSLVYLSMVLQAEGIRYGVEHWRRNRERVSGTLIWQLNDCWPVASWSSIDYFGRWKALHYAARKFYAPVLLSIEDKGESMGRVRHQRYRARLDRRSALVVGNPRRQSAQVRYRKSLGESPGRRPGVQPGFPPQVTDENRRQVVFVAELWKGTKLFSRQVATFAPNKHLELVDPHRDESLHVPQAA